MLNLADKPVLPKPIVPSQIPVPIIIHMMGLILMDIPYIRDAYPLALITPGGLVPINRRIIDDLDIALKKLEIKEQPVGYVS